MQTRRVPWKTLPVRARTAALYAVEPFSVPWNTSNCLFISSYHYVYLYHTIMSIYIQLRPTKYKSPVSRDSEHFHRTRRVESLIEDESRSPVEPPPSATDSVDLDSEFSSAENDCKCNKLFYWLLLPCLANVIRCIIQYQWLFRHSNLQSLKLLRVVK